MKYKNVIRDILKYYSNYLVDSEKVYLENIKDISNDEVLFINKIINRIWSLTLTNPNSFQNGQEFNYLVCKHVSDFESQNSYNIVNYISNDYEIISNNNVDKILLDNIYVIVTPQFNTINDNLVLPIYFNNNKRHYYNIPVSISGYFIVDTKLNYDINNKYSEELSKNSNTKLIKLDKSYYNKSLNNIDIESIINMFIIDYVYNKLDINIKERLKIQKYLLKENYNNIKNLYIKFYHNVISEKELLENVFSLFEQSMKLDKDSKVCYIKQEKKLIMLDNNNVLL